MPAPNLKFDHAVHVGKGVPCTRCHAALDRIDLATRNQLPTMSLCLGCHDSRRARAAWAVALRHLPRHAAGQHRRDRVRRRATLRAVGRAARRRAHARLPHAPLVGRRQRREVLRQLPPPGLLPCPATTASSSRSTSTATTTSRAIPSTRARTRRAATAAIARNRSASAATSGSAWSTSAPASTARSRPSAPSASIRPAGAIRSAAGDANHHKWQAERNIKQCVGCHRQETCLQCHATNASAAGGAGKWASTSTRIRPTWRGSPRCQALADRNVRMCLRCHAASDSALSCR